MSKNLLPEAVQTTPGEALKLNAWAGIAVVVSFLSRWWLAQHAGSNDLLRTGVALAPLLPSLLWARSLSGWIRRLDEMQRRIQYEAWFFAAMGTVFALTAMQLTGTAQAARPGKMALGLGWEGVFALMFLLYCAGCVISNRRYR